MITFEDIQKANAAMRTTDIKGRPYMEVNQRIKAFRMVFPEGIIHTELVSNEDGVCIMRAKVGYVTEDGTVRLLGSGTAYEKETSSFINKTSYIENCETSAVGRALGMAGFGIDTSVASFEEVANAINNQNAPQTAQKPRKQAKTQDAVIYTAEDKNAVETDKAEREKLWKILQGICKQKNIDPMEVLFRYGYDKANQASVADFYDMIKNIEEGKL